MMTATNAPESEEPLVEGQTAGPPPYSIYRLEPTTVLGLPGMFGMFDTDEWHKPTRWRFRGD